MGGYKEQVPTTIPIMHTVQIPTTISATIKHFPISCMEWIAQFFTNLTFSSYVYYEKVR